MWPWLLVGALIALGLLAFLFVEIAKAYVVVEKAFQIDGSDSDFREF